MPNEATHLFQPGQSGNPNGRPKGSVQMGTRVRKLVSDETLAKWYVAVWEGKIKPSKAQENAATWIGEYGWGKAPSHAPIEDGDPLGLDDTERAIDQAVDELATRRTTQTSRPVANGKVAARGANGK